MPNSSTEATASPSPGESVQELPRKSPQASPQNSPSISRNASNSSGLYSSNPNLRADRSRTRSNDGASFASYGSGTSLSRETMKQLNSRDMPIIEQHLVEFFRNEALWKAAIPTKEDKRLKCVKEYFVPRWSAFAMKQGQIWGTCIHTSSHLITFRIVWLDASRHYGTLWSRRQTR